MSAPRCQAQKTTRISWNVGTGGQCTREARWVDPKGHVWCSQHAKDYPTPLRKGTGKIRADLKPIGGAP